MITPSFDKWYDSLSDEDYQALMEEYDGDMEKAYNDEVSKWAEYFMEMEREDNE